MPINNPNSEDTYTSPRFKAKSQFGDLYLGSFRIWRVTSCELHKNPKSASKCENKVVKCVRALRHVDSIMRSQQRRLLQPRTKNHEGMESRKPKASYLKKGSVISHVECYRHILR